MSLKYLHRLAWDHLGNIFSMEQGPLPAKIGIYIYTHTHTYIYIYTHTDILTSMQLNHLYDMQTCKYLQNQALNIPQTHRTAAMPVIKLMVTNMFCLLLSD